MNSVAASFLAQPIGFGKTATGAPLSGLPDAGPSLPGQAAAGFDAVITNVATVVTQMLSDLANMAPDQPGLTGFTANATHIAPDGMDDATANAGPNWLILPAMTPQFAAPTAKLRAPDLVDGQTPAETLGATTIAASSIATANPTVAAPAPTATLLAGSAPIALAAPASAFAQEMGAASHDGPTVLAPASGNTAAATALAAPPPAQRPHANNAPSLATSPITAGIAQFAPDAVPGAANAPQGAGPIAPPQPPSLPAQPQLQQQPTAQPPQAQQIATPAQAQTPALAQAGPLSSAATQQAVAPAISAAPDAPLPPLALAQPLGDGHKAIRPTPPSASQNSGANVPAAASPVFSVSGPQTPAPTAAAQGLQADPPPSQALAPAPSSSWDGFAVPAPETAATGTAFEPVTQATEPGKSTATPLAFAAAPSGQAFAQKSVALQSGVVDWVEDASLKTDAAQNRLLQMQPSPIAAPIAAPATAAEPERAPGRKRFAEALTSQIKAADITAERTRIALNPRGLGHIDIEIRHDADTGMKVTIRAENNAVLQSLRDERGLLAQAIGISDGAMLDFQQRTQDNNSDADHSPSFAMSNKEDAGPSGPVVQSETISVITSDQLDITT